MKMRAAALTLASVLSLAVFGAGRLGHAEGEPISDGVVRIGLLLDMAGPYSDLTGAGSETAARMAVEDFGGKVLGKPIEILAADHQNKADIAAAMARGWFDAQHVDAILDVSASAPALAVQEIGREKGRIVSVSAPGSVRLTNEACSPFGIHYAFDTYAMAHTVGKALVKQGGSTWFFITVDYSFGTDLESDTAAVVRAAGGSVIGDVRHPLNSPDFSSYLLQAQASKAKVIGLANAGADTINTMKQAAEFGIAQGGQTIAGMLVLLNDVNSLGLQTAQGIVLSEAFYWDRNDESRAWAKRFLERMKKMPNMLQAGVYSSTMHYLKAVQAAGTDASEPVMRQMRATPINDFFAHNGRIREDGLMVHDMHLFQVKTPAESKGAWDYYKLLATVPGDEAFQPLAESRCPLVKK